MPGKRISDQDLSGIGLARRGSSMVTLGKVLLWMDLLLLTFVYVGVRSGSHFWLYWVVAEAILGVALMVIGMRRRASAIDRTSRAEGRRAA
jgi:hypothetical protein